MNTSTPIIISPTFILSGDLSEEAIASIMKQANNSEVMKGALEMAEAVTKPDKQLSVKQVRAKKEAVKVVKKATSKTVDKPKAAPKVSAPRKMSKMSKSFQMLKTLTEYEEGVTLEELSKELKTGIASVRNYISAFKRGSTNHPRIDIATDKGVVAITSEAQVKLAKKELEARFPS